MFDDIVLGRVVDFEENDISQEELNSDSLFLFDQHNLIKCAKYRISKYTLNYYLNALSHCDTDLWKIVLKELIKVYSLNSLKDFLIDSFPTEISLQVEVPKLIYFIKVDLIDYIINKNLDIEHLRNRNPFLKEISDELGLDKIPYLFKYCMNYIDKESYLRMISRIIRDKFAEYSENV